MQHLAAFSLSIHKSRSDELQQRISHTVFIATHLCFQAFNYATEEDLEGKKEHIQ